jgi:hypothetical protein
VKTAKSVIISTLALALFSTLAAKAVVQSDIFLFNSGGSSTNGIQVDASTAPNGLTILNGKRNQSANSTFGGGLMLIDQTAAVNTRRSLINNGGTLFQMDNNGVLLKVLLSTDLPTSALTQTLTGFVVNPSFSTITPANTVLQAFQNLAGNQNLILNGTQPFTGVRVTGGTAANDVIIKTNDSRVLQAQLGVPGPTVDIITSATAGNVANRLLEVNGKSLTASTTTATFRVASTTGTAFLAKVANYSPDIIVKLQTGTANQVQIINGASVVTVNSGNTNVPIPGTNLQVDSFNGTQIVFEKTSSTGVNAKKADIILHYYGQ